MSDYILGMPTREMMIQELPYRIKKGGKIIVEGVTTPQLLFKSVINAGDEINATTKKLIKTKKALFVVSIFAGYLVYENYKLKKEKKELKKEEEFECVDLFEEDSSPTDI